MSVNKIHIFCLLVAACSMVACGKQHQVDGAMTMDSAEPTDILNHFIQEHGGVNAVDDDGHSLLLVAINNNDFPTFKAALKAGADPHFSNVSEGTRKSAVVMEKAAVNKDERFLRALLAHDANPNTLDSYGKFGVIFQSITTSNRKNVELLIEFGADIDAIGANGKTPVHRAIAVKNYDIAYFLVENGANLSIADKWGNTPIGTLKMFGDAGVKIGSDHHHWYLKLLKKLDIDAHTIAKPRKVN